MFHDDAIDGDRAEGEVYVLSYYRYDENGVPMIVVVGGRYLDKYERRDGKWGIAHRVAMEDWSAKVPAPVMRQQELAGMLERGQLAGEDRSASFFQWLP